MTTIRLIIGGVAGLLSFQALPGAATAATCQVTEYPCADVFLSDATAQRPPGTLPPPVIPDPEEQTRSERTDSSGSGGGSEGGEPEGGESEN